ncbi:MAG: dependent oxidoreductase [Chthonomonadaceae bacterium]|nr:dependent oxidoreductase [Chthonomonadaceae bacterium]
MAQSFDTAVVGAGVLGLAHAYHLAKQGQRVVVFERSPQAVGASIRNFGMLWPIGQTAGEMYAMAIRSREIWLEALQQSGIWHERTGSLHLAYHEDEEQVLREFAAEASHSGYQCALLTPAQIQERSRAVHPDGLRAGLWSPTEVCVDPPTTIASLPGYLTRQYGVTFHFDTAVTACGDGMLLAGGHEWRAERLYVCGGDDFQTLFPDVLQSSGMIRCKLQMLRSQPMEGRWRLGPMLAAGLTLRHYKSFQNCPSLSALKQRVAAETPLYDRYGIHVMASQNGKGELVLGDSHEYDADISPFDKSEIDALILDYLQTFLRTPDLRIASRWHGVYAKHPTEPYLVLHPTANTTVVTGVGGAGMTLSFGLAERVVNGTL